MTLDLDELERIGKAAANPQTRGRYEDIDDEGMAFLQSALNDGTWQAMIDRIRELEEQLAYYKSVAMNPPPSTG